jgi:RNA polymerase sigma factor (sigma-70 family)
MQTTTHATYTEDDIIVRVLTGQQALFELLVRRTNPLLYKIGRSYGFNHQDTEDLMQEAHVDAYVNLRKFERRSSYSTWLTRIMLNRCNQRLRKSSFLNEIPLDVSNENGVPIFNSTNHSDTATTVMKNELTRLIENALSDLPVNYRMVFTLRELNHFDVGDTAQLLGITETNVKVRLNRAKAMLRKKLETQFTPEDIYEFNLIYCDRLTNNVMQRIQRLGEIN